MNPPSANHALEQFHAGKRLIADAAHELAGVAGYVAWTYRLDHLARQVEAEWSALLAFKPKCVRTYHPRACRNPEHRARLAAGLRAKRREQRLDLIRHAEVSAQVFGGDPAEILRRIEHFEKQQRSVSRASSLKTAG